MYKLTLKGATDYANIYAIEKAGRIVGTIEIKLAGREAGKKFFLSWDGKHSKQDIKRIFNDLIVERGI